METGNRLRVRPATSADIPAMMALEKHAVTAAHWSREQYEQVFAASAQSGDSAGGTPAGQPAGRRRYGSLAEQLPRLALVIEAESAVQGFLVARVVDTEWEIENIAVSGPARRRGLGTRLLGEFLDWARGEGAVAVFLEVRESNRAARALYEKWAFVESGRRPRYYREPEEGAVIYRLCLLNLH
jgi:ribosomal-protein-alanine N-acetyltransferase